MPDDIIEAAQQFAQTSLVSLLRDFIQSSDDKLFNKILARINLSISDQEKKEISELITPLREKLDNLSANKLVILGMAYRYGLPGVKQDHKNALPCFLQANAASKSGNAYAQYFLGRMYQHAEGIEQNLDQAIAYYRNAAEPAKNSMAMVALANIYLEGNTVPVDRALAKKYLSPAALAGNAGALYKIGLLNLKDSPEAKADYARAILFLKQAAKLGHVGALNELGKMHLFGRGVDQNPRLAIEYFEAAAELSKHDPLSIAQTAIQYKAMVFLAQLVTFDDKGNIYRETLEGDWEEGLCNGYGLMMLRAMAMDKEEKLEDVRKNEFIQRLNFIAQTNLQDVKRMGQLYGLFRSTFSKVSEERRAKMGGDEKVSIAYEEVAREVDNLLNPKLDESDRKLLAFAKEYYVFIGSLLAAQSPKLFFLKKPDGSPVSQSDFDFILPIILPEQIDGKVRGQVAPYKFSLNLSEKELTDVISRLVKPGDLVIIRSTNHAMFFAKKGDEYVFYDSNNETLRTLPNIQELSREIKNRFFLNFGYYATFQPIEIEVAQFDFVQSIKRPSYDDLLQDIISGRGVKANIDEPAWNGATSLNFATSIGNEQMVKLLLARKANPNAVDNFGISPLENAIAKGYANIVVMLAENKADLSVLRQQDTITHAVLHQYNNLIPILIKYGADCERRDNNGLQSIDHAVKNKNLEAAVILLLAMKSKSSFSKETTEFLKENREAIINAYKLLVQKQPDAQRLEMILQLIQEKNALRSYLEDSPQSSAFSPTLFSAGSAMRSQSMAKDVYECISPFRDVLERHASKMSSKQ